MTLDEFFESLASVPGSWRRDGQAIHHIENRRWRPLEVLCYVRGGTVSWAPGRLQRPVLHDHYFQHGTLLGLSERDTHAIARASEFATCTGDERHGALRRRLLEACRLPPDAQSVAVA